MAGQQEVSGFDVGTTAIVAGVTNALLFQDPSYTSGGIIKYVSGGSLLLMRAPGTGGPANLGYGATYAAATLAANFAAGKYYILDGGGLAYDGAARYYLAAIGATAVVQMVRGLSPGYTEPNSWK